MGSLIKLVGIVGTLLVSYAMLSLLLLYIGLLPLYIGLNPVADNPVCALLSYALVFVSAALVLTFFTIPVTLSIFGGAETWVKHVAVRSARWLFAAFGTVVLLYLGAGAVSTIEEGLSIGSLLVLLVSGVGIFSTNPAETTRLMNRHPGEKAGIFAYKIHLTRSFPGSTLPNEQDFLICCSARKHQTP